MNTKSIIKQAAFDLFSQKRFRDITVQDILDRAKCSRYTLY
ncbi:MAG: TetR family transcriptional regulator [Oscillospiraceae bacterium]|nr:TetR family transcriptional regulator [Oscillospiraceae bacterium]